MRAGDGGTPTSPMWGSHYYIIVKSSELPGKALAEKLGKRAVRDAAEALKWLR